MKSTPAPEISGLKAEWQAGENPEALAVRALDALAEAADDVPADEEPPPLPEHLRSRDF